MEDDIDENKILKELTDYTYSNQFAKEPITNEHVGGRSTNNSNTKNMNYISYDNDNDTYKKIIKTKQKQNKANKEQTKKEIEKPIKKKTIKKIDEPTIKKIDEKINKEIKKEIKESVNIQNISYGYKFVYFMLQKGARSLDIPMKIGYTNNVPEEKEKLQLGNIHDLRCELIIECEKMNADKLYEIICKKYMNKHRTRSWYNLSKEEVSKLRDELISKDYKITTEGRAKLTKVELKKLSAGI